MAVRRGSLTLTGGYTYPKMPAAMYVIKKPALPISRSIWSYGQVQCDRLGLERVRT
jgi:hypothetical protein